MTRIEVESGSDWSEKLKDEWNDLYSAIEFPTPFQHIDWLSSWQSTVGRTARPHVVTVRQGKELVGALALVKRSRPFAILRSMAVGPSDYLHPLVRSGSAEVFWAALSDYMDGLPKITFDLQQIRRTQWGAENDPSFIQRPQAQCLCIDLPTTMDAYTADLGKSLRYEVRKAATPTLKLKGMRIVDATPNTLSGALDVFFQLHAARWRRRGLPGAFFGRLVRLHREWAPKALANDMLRLRLLEHEGKPIGAIYGMKAGDACFFYQAGMDPESKALSPGTILIANLIESSIEEGLVRFDLMRGDEAYKRRWKPQHVFSNIRFVRPAKGLTGTISAHQMSLRAVVEDKLRSRLEGGSLVPPRRRLKSDDPTCR